MRSALRRVSGAVMDWARQYMHTCSSPPTSSALILTPPSPPPLDLLARREGTDRARQYAELYMGANNTGGWVAGRRAERAGRRLGMGVLAERQRMHLGLACRLRCAASPLLTSAWPPPCTAALQGVLCAHPLPTSPLPLPPPPTPLPLVALQRCTTCAATFTPTSASCSTHPTYPGKQTTTRAPPARRRRHRHRLSGGPGRRRRPGRSRSSRSSRGRSTLLKLQTRQNSIGRFSAAPLPQSWPAPYLLVWIFSIHLIHLPNCVLFAPLPRYHPQGYAVQLWL